MDPLGTNMYLLKRYRPSDSFCTFISERLLGTYTHINYVTEYMRVGRNPMAVIWKLLTRKEISENTYEWVIIVCFGAPCSLMKESR